jgi:preprotein translocase subunit SecG
LPIAALESFLTKMRSILIFLLTFVLVCASVFVVLVILMQRPSTNAGMGASLGGGAAETAFGSDTTKVLTKWTVSGVIVFFVAAFFLSMLHINSAHRKHNMTGVDLKQIIDLDENSTK